MVVSAGMMPTLLLSCLQLIVTAIVTADVDQVLVYTLQVASNSNISSQVMAQYTAPAKVQSISCMDEVMYIGLVDGQVLNHFVDDTCVFSVLKYHSLCCRLDQLSNLLKHWLFTYARDVFLFLCHGHSHCSM